MSDSGSGSWSKWASILISVCALGATVYNVKVANSSYKLNREIQQATIFSQFQQQYNTVSSRFPVDLLTANFRPSRGSDDYKRLRDYWIFCYAEWYETQKGRPDLFADLWANYYSGLILNALETPSLRYVLLDMFKSYGVKSRDMEEFYAAMRALAQSAGEPLTDDKSSPQMSEPTKK